MQRRKPSKAPSPSAQAKMNRAALAEAARARREQREHDEAKLQVRAKPSAAATRGGVSSPLLEVMFGGPGDWPRHETGERPSWDSTPMRNRPAALRGLKPVTPEPWAHDEVVYNAYKHSKSRGAPHARHAHAGMAEHDINRTARKREKEFRHTQYMGRFDSKFVETNDYDGNPFT